MGMNIYLMRLVSKKEFDSMKSNLQAELDKAKTCEDVKDVVNCALEKLEKLNEEIHICKISCGWQLLFQANEHLYECTWKSMEDYIRKALDSGEWEMKDEYGGDFSLEDLKEELDCHAGGFDYNSYVEYKNKKDDYCCGNKGLEFISDGMRWTDAEFS